MNKLKILFVALALTFLSACGERVMVNPGEVAKELGPSGFKKKVYDSGSFRMSICYPWSACPKLVRLQTSTSSKSVTIDSVFLPKSNIALEKIEFGMQFRIKKDSSIQKAFNEVKAILSPTNSSEMIITSDELYNTYIKRKAPETVISVLRTYTVDEVLTKPDEISREVLKAVNYALKDTPIEMTEFGFPNGVGTPPKTVLDSKNALYAIEEEKARKIKAIEAELEIEEKRQAVARKRAINDNEIAKSLGLSVAQYQCLRSMDSFADAATEGTTVTYVGDCGLSNKKDLIPIR